MIKGVDSSIEMFAQLLMDSNPQYIFWKDPNGVYLGCNTLYAHFCNIPNTQAIVGTTDYDYMHKEEADICISADKEVIATGDAILNFEEYVTDANGVSKWYSINKVPLKDQEGEIVGVLGTMTDVTELKEKSQIIKDQNEALNNQVIELEAKNKELEEFAYIAAHDLQEPLSNILTFSNLLDKVNSFDNDFLEHILSNSNRMSSLIDGLLQYSIVGKKSDKKLVNLNEVVQMAMEILHDKIEETNAQINVKNLGEIKGYQAELVSLFQNLLSNSLKYKQEEGVCNIVIYTEKKEENEICICVEDNGIGFEQKHSNRIFEIFKRLHTDDEINGVGIGLSICMKIIRLHKGAIWCESQPNKGAKFFISLPKE